MTSSGRKKRSHLSATCRGVMIGMGLSYVLMSLLEGKTGLHSWEPSRNLKEEEEFEVEEEEEEEIDPDIEATAIVCIIILLIGLTIAFEEIEELIIESSPRDFRPIVASLFQEMTILGFLSLCTFCITKTPFPSILSRHLFGEEEFLLEIFEMVHFCLFFIMIFFVAQVLVLLKESIKIQKKWHAMDRACMELRYGSSTSFQHGFAKEEMDVFTCLRDEFILERSLEPPFDPAEQENRVAEDFNFGRYLSICLGISVSHVVHVSVASWVFFIFLTVVLYLIMLILEGNLMVLGWIWVGFGWMDMLLFRFVFERYLIGILKALALPSPASESSSGTEQETLLSDGSGSNLPAWCQIDLDEYMSSRSWLVRRLCHKLPTRQDALFWLEEKGPHLHLVVLQINLVFRGVYGATLILIFIPAFREASVVIFASYIILAFIPIFGFVGHVRRVFAVMSIVGSTGALRLPQVVSDVIRKEKTLLVVRAFLILDKMHQLASADTEDITDASSSSKELRQLTHLETMEVGATFDAFDRDGDGQMSISELDRVMHAMAGHTSEEKLRRILSSLDMNGDGIVSKPEFLEWYRRYMIPKEHAVSLEERAHHLFHLFDKNNSGKISISEFKKSMDALNIGFTVDEVGMLIQELDEDDNVMIGLDEFHELLEKHYPEELEHHHS